MRATVDLVLGSVGMLVMMGLLLAILAAGGAIAGAVMGREPAGEP